MEVDNTRDEDYRDLVTEVKRQREILDGMLPGYMRLQDTVDRHQTEIADLRSRLQLAETSLQKKTQVLAKLIDNYYDVKDYIIGEEGKKVGEAAPAPVHEVQEDVTMMNEVDNETMKEIVGAEGAKKKVGDADNAEDVADVADVAEEDSPEKKDAVNEEAEEEVAGKDVVGNEVTEDVVAENEVTGNEGPLQPTSDMPPPSTPTVTLQPPTPQTSQEGETSVPTSLLQVPINNTGMHVVDAENNLPTESKIPPSDTKSISDVVAEPRRSSRIRSRSPTPVPSVVPTKRKTEASGDEPVAKKAR